MRKKEVRPSEIYASERAVACGTSSESLNNTTKDLLNLVVVGHVDSGKSTLMGHLLFELGQGNHLFNAAIFLLFFCVLAKPRLIDKIITKANFSIFLFL